MRVNRMLRVAKPIQWANHETPKAMSENTTPNPKPTKRQTVVFVLVGCILALIGVVSAINGYHALSLTDLALLVLLIIIFKLKRNPNAFK
jgi:uncharacterized membrane protein